MKPHITSVRVEMNEEYRREILRVCSHGSRRGDLMCFLGTGFDIAARLVAEEGVIYYIRPEGLHHWGFRLAGDMWKGEPLDQTTGRLEDRVWEDVHIPGNQTSPKWVITLVRVEPNIWHWGVLFSNSVMSLAVGNEATFHEAIMAACEMQEKLEQERPEQVRSALGV